MIPTARALSRRGFLGGLAAACAAALVPRPIARAVVALPEPQRHVLDLSSFDAMLKEYYRPEMVAAAVSPPPLFLNLKKSAPMLSRHPGYNGRFVIPGDDE
jgi:hypothetical protein